MFLSYRQRYAEQKQCIYDVHTSTKFLITRNFTTCHSTFMILKAKIVYHRIYAEGNINNIVTRECIYITKSKNNDTQVMEDNYSRERQVSEFSLDKYTPSIYFSALDSVPKCK